MNGTHALWEKAQFCTCSCTAPSVNKPSVPCKHAVGGNNSAKVIPSGILEVNTLHNHPEQEWRFWLGRPLKRSGK